ncbi:MAG: O-antigen ligase [Pseudomonadota bacterium]
MRLINRFFASPTSRRAHEPFLCHLQGENIRPMKISHASLIDPDRNTLYVVPAIVLSLFVFAYSTRFGPISILAFYGVWLFPFALAPQTVLARPGPVLFLLIVPTFFLFSMLWSDVPATTLRGSIQYGITVFAGLMAARITSVPNLALGGTIGGLIILLYSAANGGYSYDYIDGDFAFNGAFSSKNQLGYYATLTILFALSLIVVFKTQRLLIPLAAATAALGAIMLWMSDSATSLLSAIGAFGAMGFMWALLGLKPWLRRATVFSVLTGCVAAIFGGYRAGAFDAVLGAFGRDASLTGRTYLWNEAITFGADRPLLGLGYNAFWTHGRDAAEQLWQEFYITARTGFHFHNLFIETYVAGGLIGLALIIVLSALLIALPLRAAIDRGNVAALILFAGLSMLFLIRSIAEVDFITAHTAGTFLVAYILLRLFDHHRDVRHATHLSRPMLRPRHPSLGPAQGSVI